MPKRPTFWIHRTRRFWFGVALLIGLVVGTLLAGYYEVTTRRDRGSWSVEVRYEISLRDGGISLSRQAHKPPWSNPSLPVHSSWSWEADQHYCFRALPSLQFGQGNFELFLPGTLPIALVCLLWPLWMFRAERREQKLYEADREPPPAP